MTVVEFSSEWFGFIIVMEFVTSEKLKSPIVMDGYASGNRVVRILLVNKCFK